MTFTAALAELHDNASIAFGPLEDADARQLAALLGCGEVRFRLAGGEAQESVFPGVWLVRSGAGYAVECGPVPRLAGTLAAGRSPTIPAVALPEGCMNAPALLHEIALALGDGVGKIINLTNLPLSDIDHAALDAALGDGGVSAEIAGHGVCRVRATAVRRVWRVRYFNADDRLLLDSIEIADLPVAVVAQPEDIADGLAGLHGLLRELEEE